MAYQFGTRVLKTGFGIRHSAFRVACFVALVLLRGAFTSSQPELVDRIVAIIDRDVVTLSEAEQAAGFLELRGIDNVELADVVERLIEARLIERDVLRFTDDPLPEERVLEAVASLREAFGTEDAFEAMLTERSVSEQELFSELRRQLTVTRYLERRFRALAYVTEEEIQSFFDAEVIPELPAERAPTLEEVDQIRRILEEQKFNERVEQWLDGLKQRARIRRYVW